MEVKQFSWSSFYRFILRKCTRVASHFIEGSTFSTCSLPWTSPGPTCAGTQQRFLATGARQTLLTRCFINRQGPRQQLGDLSLEDMWVLCPFSLIFQPDKENPREAKEHPGDMADPFYCCFLPTILIFTQMSFPVSPVHSPKVLKP